mmetsp:Transcript_43338/g.78896  ORF Transcript_43338/g.78896 Transcript_43338/m.78896 type:complete len:145 (-) Transcript_43338:1212-1646(-)
MLAFGAARLACGGSTCTGLAAWPGGGDFTALGGETRKGILLVLTLVVVLVGIEQLALGTAFMREDPGCLPVGDLCTCSVAMGFWRELLCWTFLGEDTVTGVGLSHPRGDLALLQKMVAGGVALAGVVAHDVGAVLDCDTQGFGH